MLYKKVLYAERLMGTLTAMKKDTMETGETNGTAGICARSLAFTGTFPDTVP